MPRGGSEPIQHPSARQSGLLLVCGFGVTSVFLGVLLGASSRRAGGLLVFQSKTDLHLRNTRMQRFLLLFALLPALAALSSCGSNTTTTATPAITVSGAASTVSVNGTVQFTATITNLS